MAGIIRGVLGALWGVLRGGTAGEARARRRVFATTLASVVLVAACGSRTGVLFEVVTTPEDAGFDAPDDTTIPPEDAGPDTEPPVDAPGFDVTPMCRPGTCDSLHYTCGVNGDGCGNLIQCGTCMAPERCGIGGYSRCGGTDAGSNCKPLTCKDLDFNCGPAGDGCGGLLECGSCQPPLTCGGAGTPGRCGGGCTGLCMQQVNCESGSTTVSGKIVTGTLPEFGGPDPVFNALVYVPNAPVQAFTKGVACNQCGTDVSGDPLVATNTAPDGTFTLLNMPVGKDIPLVIQLGRWRRQVTIPAVPACTNTALPETLTRLPRNSTEGDIPATAISTGEVDAIECVVMKMGVDASEFTLPSGGGRIQMYQSNGAILNDGSVPARVLWEDSTKLDLYDQILLPCEGSATPSPPASPKTPAEQQNMIGFSVAGGRIFTTHYGYTWLYNDPPFSGTANFTPLGTGYTTERATLDTSFPGGQSFQAWLVAVGAIHAGGSTLELENTRADVSSVNAPSEQYIYGDGNGTGRGLHTLQYDFLTPVGLPQSQQCGRVTFSDFHVVNYPVDAGVAVFPSECGPGPMTSQEKALEFMLLNLASCVPAGTGECIPRTCADQNLGCGPAGDGCGHLIECGTCTPPLTCGGGHVDGQCGAPDGGVCFPRTCGSLGFDCGINGDGCGGVINCGTCTPPAICGGGGRPSVCGI